MAKKLRLGWFTLTCCEDNAIMFVELLNTHFFEWKKQIDFRYCKFLKSKNTFDEFDVALVEGAVSSEREKKRLLDIRSKTKYLVAVGSCAVNGRPSAQRNDFAPELKKVIKPFIKKWKLYDNVLSAKDVVKVDESVDGCPMNEEKFLQVLDKYLVEFKVK
ncbi:Sulfhydrogenase 2 subunit delta [Candidatus Gugararchaeum adminiculabundum]|nr:Sulfhydrogenase 2 subunit delta [Candidatus Gugararchaeum adminiculabundum]